MSDTYQSLSHARWNCKYHVVFVPKRRRKALFGTIRKALAHHSLISLRRQKAMGCGDNGSKFFKIKVSIFNGLQKY